MEIEVNKCLEEKSITDISISYDKLSNKFFFKGNESSSAIHYDLDFTGLKNLGILMGFQNNKYIYGKDSIVGDKESVKLYFYEGAMYLKLDTNDIKIDIDGLVCIVDNKQFKSKRKTGKKLNKLKILLDITNKKTKKIQKIIGYEYKININYN